MWITINCGKFLKRQEYQTILPVSWETCMQVKKQQQQSGSKLGMEYSKNVYCHPVYLTYWVQFSRSVVSNSLQHHEPQAYMCSPSWTLLRPPSPHHPSGSSLDECWILSQLFYSRLSLSSRSSLVPLWFLPLWWYHLDIWGVDIFPSNLDSIL